MIEVLPRLFIGNQDDFYALRALGEDGKWFIVQAAKEPFHRDALGYKGRGAPKDQPGYLWVELEENKFVMNLVNPASASYIPVSLVQDAMTWVEQKYHLPESKVLIHCNRGESRAPMLGMIYMRRHGVLVDDYPQAKKDFMMIYPEFKPSAGVEEFLIDHWKEIPVAAE